MKRIVFKIELLLTLLCLTLIYTLATKDSEPSDHNPNTALIMALQDTSSDTQPVHYSENQDIYDAAATLNTPQTLKAMAKHEAERMIETGDTSRYTEEIEKNKTLMRVMGY